MAPRSRMMDQDPTRWYMMAQLTAVCARVTEAEAELEVSKRMRDDFIRKARNTGMSLAEIANLAGLSKARIQQLTPVEDDDREPDERPEQAADQAAV
jgi:DNA-binding transcriptional MerR regulator